MDNYRALLNREESRVNISTPVDFEAILNPPSSEIKDPEKLRQAWFWLDSIKERSKKINCIRKGFFAIKRLRVLLACLDVYHSFKKEDKKGFFINRLLDKGLIMEKIGFFTRRIKKVYDVLIKEEENEKDLLLFLNACLSIYIDDKNSFCQLDFLGGRETVIEQVTILEKNKGDLENEPE